MPIVSALQTPPPLCFRKTVPRAGGQYRRVLAMRLLQYLYQRFYIVSIQCIKIVTF